MAYQEYRNDVDWVLIVKMVEVIACNQFFNA